MVRKNLKDLSKQYYLYGFYKPLVFKKVSYGASEVKMIITLKINTNTDGSVNSVKIYDKLKYQKDKFYRATADAARRAVLDSSPLPLPQGKEKKFENLMLDFDPSFIKSY